MKFSQVKIPQIGDYFAVPFFIWLVVYFYRKSQTQVLTNEENVLFLFCCGGLLADLSFILFDLY
jgi:hypothetical protein